MKSDCLGGPLHVLFSSQRLRLLIAGALSVLLLSVLLVPSARASLQLQCNGLPATIVMNSNGGNGQGTPGDDVIIGTPGDDVINAGAGNDTVCAGGGADTIDGGSGEDRLFGAKGNDVIRGGDGDDALHGGQDADELFGDDGNDRIFGYAANDEIWGGAGDDRLHGNFGNDMIEGGLGDDRIFGYGDDDTINGGPGNDLIGGNFGNDTIDGGADDDIIYGSDGTDSVRGGAGDDQVAGNSSDDKVFGDAGDDELDGGIDNDLCDGGQGTNVARRCETERNTTGSSPSALTLIKVSGDDQAGLGGRTLPEALVIQVNDADGSPVPGIGLDTSVTRGSGVIASISTTDALGRVSTEWTLGQDVMAQQVTFAISGESDIHVVFNATAQIVPLACERRGSGVFSVSLAQEMLELASQAYKDAPSLGECWVLEGSINIASTDTQGYVARNPFTGDVTAAFRGTEFSLATYEDIVIDAAGLKTSWRLSNGTVVRDAVHSGFYLAYFSAKARLDALLERAIAKTPEQQRDTARVNFTGHSLGGALATLASLDQVDALAGNGYERRNVVMYSFGAPRSITDNLGGHYNDKVPSARAVINSDDPVPNLPPPGLSNKYRHVNAVTLLHRTNDGSRFEHGPGSRSHDCPKLANFSNHGRVEYDIRLESGFDGATPKAWLTVVTSGLNKGRFELNWSGVNGLCDRVGIFRAPRSGVKPSDPNTLLPTKNAIPSWEWADDPNPSTGASTQWTGYTKADGYHAGYINAFGELVQVSPVYIPRTPTVSLSLTVTRQIKMTWNVSDAGRKDYVAVYDSNPSSGNPPIACLGCRERAIDGPTHITNQIDSPFTKKTRWIAYVQVDEDNNARILALRSFSL